MTVYTSKISVSSVFKQNLGRNDVKKNIPCLRYYQETSRSCWNKSTVNNREPESDETHDAYV